MRDALGIGVAVGVSGLAFGTAAVASGLSVAQACALSVLTFSGASQFALIGVVAGGGNLIAGTAGALLLGTRNTLYGLRMADLLGVRGVRRAVAAQGVIDETAAMTLAQPDRAAARTAFSWTFATLFVAWNLTTLIGALATERVGDTAAFGLDAVGPAIFLALLWPRLREGRRERLVALLGAAIALATAPFAPSGVPVLLAAVAALIGLLPPRGSTTRGATADDDTGTGDAGAGASDTPAWEGVR
ncbi:branched-chain amino acid ABC transporter permease [Nocardiopsis gilva YIM 90087]|uniref:Branched-chain amino acid ABC transporter permease n=1 Tax=Nocardiopsis gilva YIM 90087 TaxID=1235441 RepID=A0A223S5P1_9ACTN|nr:AzlC family ABC transporter permease [Nocardiopsis gilva]ASU83438.1 branched-chain amino acid ABC transporter permease [Nocardiopsis gilva YIM 90087]